MNLIPRQRRATPPSVFNRVAAGAAMAAGLLLIAPGASAAEVGGVKLDDQLSVAGAPLVLNGAGVRYKAVFKVYAAGLYLGRKAASTEDVLGAPGPKRLQLVMLRDIESAELGKLFARGVEDNASRAEMARLIPGLLRMSQMFFDQKRLGPSDTIQIDWVPGAGTVITIKNKVQGEPIREPEFYAAVMRIWLGATPADWQLKEALLGKKAA